MKTWLITGASSGLGKALADAALRRGDRVAATFRNTKAASTFEATARGRAFAVTADLSDLATIPPAVAAAEAALGPIDVLVNNAGYGLIGAVEEASAKEIERQFAVNVFAPLALIRAVLPGMRVRGAGHIVNVTSVSGHAAWGGTGVYCASKFALEGVGEALAQEVGPLGIKVTNVAPGGLRTDYAGRSLVVTAASVADYADTAHLSRRLLEAGAGQEKGDPGRAADAILKLVDSDAPPVHLLLGADAIHYATRKYGQVQTEIGEWIETTTSIAFPNV